MSAAADPLLKAARDLLDYPDPETLGLWPRAAALLARQALESGLDEFWGRAAPGVESCSARAQLICLRTLLGNREVAERTAHAWASLSRACHHHAYELPPTTTELRNWIDDVDAFLSRAVHGSGGP